MASLTLTVPDKISDYIEAQVGDDFADTGEVISELVRRDKERRITELRQRIEESAASGTSTRTFEERIAEGDRILRERDSAGGRTPPFGARRGRNAWHLRRRRNVVRACRR